ncbi:SMI1/KNR4 family protein [Kitasatospora azatica]|uniref:SMI1/KNR4 family protein n=1 Tax=Kitasatospora azatica TaxID=58347 RepID=UPI00056CC9EB|nr:SMI1/KNR4 family protein [Kitasatospora azatica]
MTPDLVLLRALIDSSPAITNRPECGAPEAWIRSAESALGPLAPSYRWWLAEYNDGSLHGAPLARLGPPGEGEAGQGEAGEGGADDVTAGWRLDGDRLCFYAAAEADGGDTYHLVLDGPAEHAVVRRGRHSGAEDLVADTFAGFLTVQVAQTSGLGGGPVPALARLWRSTPGVQLPNGITIYGPQDILERNETYEVGEYQPDWILIGDDSGGNGLFIRRSTADRPSVYRLDLGAGDNDIETPGVGEWLTDDLLSWLSTGAT